MLTDSMNHVMEAYLQVGGETSRLVLVKESELLLHSLSIHTYYREKTGVDPDAAKSGIFVLIVNLAFQEIYN